ncbi:MAG: NUDIX domain-containing protein [Omnitrophica WOR_2 bacterium]
MIDESWYIKPPGIREGVSSGGVVARAQDGIVWVALARENIEDAYILPKGRVEPGESIEEAARREIMEEAGLSGLTLLADLGVQERLNFEKVEWKKIYYFLYTTNHTGGRPTDPNHQYRCDWFPIDSLPPMLWPEQLALIMRNRAKIIQLVLNEKQTLP